MAKFKVLMEFIGKRGSLGVKSCILGRSAFGVDLIGGLCRAAFGSQYHRIAFA